MFLLLVLGNQVKIHDQLLYQPCPNPSGSDPSSSSSDSGGGGGHPDGGWSPPHHGSSGGGNSPGGFTPNQGGYMPNRSVGIGSNAVAMTEREILRTKDLALIKIDQLPTSAASYRGWRNSFVTKCCSIDLTGEDLVLQWIQKAFEYSANGGELLNSGMLPQA